jgi:hypothetical protein
MRHTWSAKDGAYAVAVDPSGQPIIVGATPSGDFPVTLRAYQTRTHVNNDDHVGYVSKLSSNLGALVFSTFLGGTFRTVLYAITADAASAEEPALPIFQPPRGPLRKPSYRGKETPSTPATELSRKSRPQDRPCSTPRTLGDRVPRLWRPLPLMREDAHGSEERRPQLIFQRRPSPHSPGFHVPV